jgi:hypothetical protein
LLSAVPFSKALEEANVITLPKPDKDQKFSQNLRPIGLLSTAGKVLEKVILEIVQRHIEERGLLNGSQFGFCSHHGMTLMEHITLNFNKNMSMAEVFLDIKKTFDKTWHPGLS